MHVCTASLTLAERLYPAGKRCQQEGVCDDLDKKQSEHRQVPDCLIKCLRCWEGDAQGSFHGGSHQGKVKEGKGREGKGKERLISNQ